MTTPAMEFGMGVFPFTRFRSPGEMLETVIEAEELGFDVVTLPVHLLPPEWPAAEMSTKFWYDLPTLGAFLAGATKKIRFLTSVMVVPYHPPVQMAKALATFDHLSGGRVLLGVGAGWMKAEFRRLGLPFEARGEMTDEYLRAMIELWTSDSPVFHGKWVSFEDVSFFPRPVQRPIPIMVGGSGRAPLRRAAQLGHGWFPMTATLDELAEGVATIRRLRAEAGRADAPLWVGFTGFGMASDPETARMRGHVDNREVPIVAPRRTPDEAVAAIQGYAAAGVNFLSVGFEWASADDLRRELRSFATEVMPAFR
jgi:probable F420-dependent oxidoreductase